MEEKRKNAIELIIIVGIVIVLCVVFNLLTNGSFLTRTNLRTLLIHAILPCFMAWGLMFVFACDFTDMSLGAISIIAANMSGLLGLTSLGYFGIIIGGIGTAMALCLLNFLIFAKSGIPTWVVSIGMVLVYESVAILYSNSRISNGLTIAQLPEQLRKLSASPYVFIVFGIGFVIAYFLYNRTTYGYSVRALGSGQKQAESMGIKVFKTLVLTGLVVGLFVGFYSFLSESYNARVTAKTGLTSMILVFQPLAALMLAQVMKSRINIVIGVPIATLLIYAVFNVLTLLGVPSGTLQEAVLGLVIIVFAVLAQRRQKKVVK